MARSAETSFYIALHTLITAEISFDEVRSLVRCDAKLLGKTVGSLPVNNSEVHRFRPFALFRRHSIDRYSEHFCGCTLMDIFPGGESSGKSLVSGQVGHDPQLHLRVIGRDKGPARLRNECP